MKKTPKSAPKTPNTGLCPKAERFLRSESKRTGKGIVEVLKTTLEESVNLTETVEIKCRFKRSLTERLKRVCEISGKTMGQLINEIAIKSLDEIEAKNSGQGKNRLLELAAKCCQTSEEGFLKLAFGRK